MQVSPLEGKLKDIYASVKSLCNVTLYCLYLGYSNLLPFIQYTPNYRTVDPQPSVATLPLLRRLLPVQPSHPAILEAEEAYAKWPKAYRTDLIINGVLHQQLDYDSNFV